MNDKPQIVRQWVLLRKLESNRRPWSVAELHAFLEGEGFECHERTVRRDLKQLFDAGFHLSDDDEGKWRLAGKGTASERTVELSGLEMVALLVAEQSVAGSPMEGTLRALHQRMRAMLSPGERTFADELKLRIRASAHGPVALEGDGAQLVALTEAVNGQKLARIRYWSPSSGETERVIEPYLLWQARGGLYVVSHDHRSGQNRTFAVQRISAVEVLDQTFEPDPTFDPVAHTRRGFGVFDGPKYRIQVEFHRDIAYLVTERQWHHTQRVVDTDWGVQLTWHMSGLVEVASWVAGFGGRARVLSPPELADRVRELHREGLEVGQGAS